MFQGPRRVKHKGKNVLIADYTGLKGQAYIDAINRCVSDIVRYGLEDQLTLSIIKDSYADREVLNTFKESASALKPFCRKNAVVGVTGVKEYLLSVLNKFEAGAKPFDSVEAALDWLAE